MQASLNSVFKVSQMKIKLVLFGSLAVPLARAEQGNLIDSITKNLYMRKDAERVPKKR